MGLPFTFAGWKSTTCYSCNTAIGMESELYDQRLSDHRSFWCPNGHEQHFTGDTPAQKQIQALEAELAKAKADRDRAHSSRQWAETRAKGANMKAGKAKAALKRLTHRVECGVCPHCQRTFKQLAAHIKSKHKATVLR